MSPDHHPEFTDRDQHTTEVRTDHGTIRVCTECRCSRELCRCEWRKQ